MNRTKRFRPSRPEQALAVVAIASEDIEALVDLGFAIGTAQQYVAFAKLAKTQGERAMSSYSALSKTLMKKVCDLVALPAAIRDYKNLVSDCLDDLGIEEVFRILDATQDLIAELGIERE